MYSTRPRRGNGLAHILSCFLIVGGGALLLLPAIAHAACGLEGCPAEVPVEGESRYYLEHEVREFSYSSAESEGNYSRFQTRFEAIRSGWALGVFVPVVHLRDPAENATGTSGVVLFGERTVSSATTDVFGYGMQLELPGSGSGRIASDHAELLPYISIRTEQAGATWFAMTGARVGLHDAEPVLEPADVDYTTARTPSAGKVAHGDEDEVAVVNPHEKWEMTARVGVNLGDLPGSVRPSFYVQGDRVLQGKREGDTFGSAGVMFAWQLGEHWSMRPVAEVPFGGLRRFDWSAGIGMRVSL